jgi:hypothetical protein
MRRKVLTLFWCGQACFFGGLAICLLLRPEGLSVNIGLSLYGILRDTLPFYLICLLGPAFFSLLAARVINLPELRTIRYCLIPFAILVTIVASVPFVISVPVYWVHTTAGISAFAVQVYLSLWIVAKTGWPIRSLIFFLVEAAIGVASFMFVFLRHGYLLQGQIAFQAAYSLVLFYGFKALLPTGETNLPLKRE